MLVFVKGKDLDEYILKASATSLVKYRYSILNTLIQDSLDILSLLYDTNELDVKDRERAVLIGKARTKLKLVDFLSTLAYEVGCFTEKQHDVIMLKIGDCSKYLLGFYNHARKASAI
jgi:hypothetical protein